MAREPRHHEYYSSAEECGGGELAAGIAVIVLRADDQCQQCGRDSHRGDADAEALKVALGTDGAEEISDREQHRRNDLQRDIKARHPAP